MAAELILNRCLYNGMRNHSNRRLMEVPIDEKLRHSAAFVVKIDDPAFGFRVMD